MQDTVVTGFCKLLHHMTWQEISRKCNETVPVCYHVFLIDSTSNLFQNSTHIHHYCFSKVSQYCKTMTKTERLTLFIMISFLKRLLLFHKNTQSRWKLVQIVLLASFSPYLKYFLSHCIILDAMLMCYTYETNNLSQDAQLLVQAFFKYKFTMLTVI